MIIGAEIRKNRSENSSLKAAGFYDDALNFIGHATGYPTDSKNKPSGNQDLSTEVGFFANELLIVVIALGEGSGVVISLIGIDDSDTVAAHRDVAEQGMRIVAEFLFQGVESRDIGRHLGEELIEIYER